MPYTELECDWIPFLGDKYGLKTRESTLKVIPLWIAWKWISPEIFSIKCILSSNSLLNNTDLVKEEIMLGREGTSCRRIRYSQTRNTRIMSKTDQISKIPIKFNSADCRASQSVCISKTKNSSRKSFACIYITIPQQI